MYVLVVVSVKAIVTDDDARMTVRMRIKYPMRPVITKSITTILILMICALFLDKKLTLKMRIIITDELIMRIV